MQKPADSRVRTAMPTLAVLALAACITFGSAGASSPAFAAPNSLIEVSADGVAWHESLGDPLFDPATNLVPGDARTAAFLVRNLGGTDAWLSVGALRGITPRPLVESDLVLRVRVDGGDWAAISGGQTATRLSLAHSGETVAPTHVELRAAFPASAGNDSQLGTAQFTVTVNLTEAVDPEPGEDLEGGDSNAGLPGGNGADLAETGAARFFGVWIAAAVVLGAGAALLLDPVMDRRRASCKLKAVGVRHEL